MTTVTTTAAECELPAIVSAGSAMLDVRPSRPGPLTVAVGAVCLALWLTATLAVLTGRWQPPVLTDLSGRAAVASGQAATGR